MVVFSSLILCKASLAWAQNAQQSEEGCQERGEPLGFKSCFDTAANVNQSCAGEKKAKLVVSANAHTRVPTLSASPGHGAEPAVPPSGPRRR